MPNRILKESVCTSPNIGGLTWFEEVCVYRLLVQCDDYGRLDARPLFLRSRLFPLRADLAVETVADAIKSLERAELIDTYSVADRPYLEIRKWGNHQRIRNKRSKCPSPCWADKEEDDDFPPFVENV